MVNDTLTDKVILDLNDDEDLQEYFSQKEAGDTCRFEITATLDENANKKAVLSITKVKVLAFDDPDEGEEGDGKEPPDDKEDGGKDEMAGGDEPSGTQPSSDDSSVVQWAKGKSKKTSGK